MANFCQEAQRARMNDLPRELLAGARGTVLGGRKEEEEERERTPHR